MKIPELSRAVGPKARDVRGSIPRGISSLRAKAEEEALEEVVLHR
jgi:hypothetical protein